ncbi:MAG: hypothetical protein H0U54_17435 [Acidobacteria bacterium]|nr:hypothetical protein [Acidobacteriota bacterium]
MSKSITLIRGVLIAVIVVSGIMLVACNKDGASSTSSSSQTSGVTIKDPDGTYKYFSDPSITKQPQKDAVFGNGQTISIEYDGSKSKEGGGDSLFYELYYVDTEGSVRVMTGATFDGITKGTFSTNSKVYDSDADGRPGFMKVIIVQNAKFVGGEQGFTGKEVKLGMYPIKFEISK